jgi:hypothetical protein
MRLAERTISKAGPVQAISDYCMHVLIATIGAASIAAVLVIVTALILSITPFADLVPASACAPTFSGADCHSLYLGIGICTPSQQT